MATVLQRIKDKRMTSAQERESSVVFEMTAEGSDTMTVKQLKMCLRALDFNITKCEAQALVYEFDYTDTNTIDLADFQKIFLAKALEKSERDMFDQAFRSMSSDTTDKVSLRQLSSALHTADHINADNNVNDNSGGTTIDDITLRHQMALQYYDDGGNEVVQGFLADVGELVPKATKNAVPERSQEVIHALVVPCEEFHHQMTSFTADWYGYCLLTPLQPP